jgi:hypothetical protein
MDTHYGGLFQAAKNPCVRILVGLISMPANSAAYMRTWRKISGPKKIRVARQEGIAEGVERCYNLMRTLYGGRVLTGEEAAVAIARALMPAKKL